MTDRTPAERFWVKVDRRGPNECWHWTGYVGTNGYATFFYRGQSRGAHRFAYEEQQGVVPDGLFIDHNCHNQDETCRGGDGCLHRRCVNPAHLRAVTPTQNQHASPHTAATVTHCPKGHAYADGNTGRWTTGARYCRRCNRERQRITAEARNAQQRERYATLRGAGLSAKEAAPISMSKAAMAAWQES